MRRDAVIASGALHVAVIALAYFGLPALFHPAPIEESGPISVEVVTLSQKPAPPVPAAKPAPEPPKPKAPPPPEKAAPPPPPPPPDPEPVAAPEPESVPVPAPKPKPKPVEAPKPKPKPEPVKEAKIPPRPKHKPKPPPPKETLTSLLKDIRKDLKPAAEKPEKKPAKTPAKPKDLAKDLVAGLEPQRAAPTPQTSTLAQHEASQIASAVRNQITPCWAVPAGAKDARDMRIGIRISLNPDGTLRGVPSVEDQARIRSDPVFRAFAESALRAIQNPRCSPLHLPPDRYATWSDMTIVFDPRELVGP